jgi:hypothetical protein
MIMKRQLIVFAIVAALTVGGVLNLGTVGVSAVEPGHIYISPAYVNVAGCSEIGSNYTFSICSNYTGIDVIGYAFKLTYDPSVLHGVNVTNGDVITEAVNTTLWNSTGFDNTKGELGLTGANFFYLNPPPSTVNGTGILANVTFTVVGCGISNIDFVDDDETKLIGWDGSDEYIIIDRYLPEIGRLVGAVFDHSASHDVAIIDVSLNQTVVVQGSDVGIDVTAENQGGFTESFTVTVYRDATAIQALPVTDLAAGNDTTLTFTWDTTGIPLDSYVISANASIVAEETDTADNGKIDGTVTIGSKSVEISYIVTTRRGYGVSAGYTTWSVNVTVTVHNNCTLPINCTVNLYYYNATVTQQIGASQNVNNLDPDGYTVFTRVWDLSACMACGNYTLKANATIPSIGSFQYVGGKMTIKYTGDVNGDNIVDGGDQIQVGNALWSNPGDSAFNLYADVNGDFSTDGGDQIAVGNRLWQGCP